MALPSDHEARLARARLSLEGLALGDAFGERFFGDEAAVLHAIGGRVLPRAPWRWTDDTAMALSIFEALRDRGAIDADDLAARFAARYVEDPGRGYGGTAHSILRAIAAGESWRTAAASAFGGMGSMGNGGAMRVAPVGAYFAGDVSAVVAAAAASAAPTHAHAEGAAGAVAVALAGAFAVSPADARTSLLAFVHANTPPSETRDGIARAADLGRDASVQLAASVLGTGGRLTSQDTVPFALWCADRHLASYEEALWTTVAGLGDRDTTCAIVGGIVALRVGAVPTEWIARREPLPLAP